MFSLGLSLEPHHQELRLSLTMLDPSSELARALFASSDATPAAVAVTAVETPTWPRSLRLLSAGRAGPAMPDGCIDFVSTPLASLRSARSSSFYWSRSSPRSRGALIQINPFCRAKPGE